MGKYLWLAVTADKYELPLAVCDTAKELGELYGIKKNSVITAVKKQSSGRGCGRKIIKVPIEEEVKP